MSKKKQKIPKQKVVNPEPPVRIDRQTVYEIDGKWYSVGDDNKKSFLLAYRYGYINTLMSSAYEIVDIKASSIEKHRFATNILNREKVERLLTTLLG